jgi:DNA-directed RNA polymerase specialized sigma24 family protein
MRRHLIDLARGRPAVEFVALEGVRDFLPADSAKLDLALTVDRLLERLAGLKPDLCMLVELKVFLRLSDEEAASTLGLTLRTVQRKWHDARRWLYEELGNAQ